MAQRKKTKPKVIYSTQPRIRLEPYKGRNSRTTCPSCGQKNKFSHFIDVTTGLRIGDEFGRCERVEHCGYTKSPTGDDLKGQSLEVSSNDVLEAFRAKDITNILESKFVTKSMNETLDNFSGYLYNNFNNEIVKKILIRYKVGCVKKWDSDATVFWQIDRDFDVRTGKIMLYNYQTGKRVKNPFNHISWAHTPYKENDFGDNADYCLTQCFFGEHLLNEEGIEEFNVVESEKTAILCSIAKPSSYWIATGGLMNINEERLLPFIDKKLTFYPDKGLAYKEWEKKLKPFMKDFNITISDFVEKITTLNNGDDIGDFIIQKYTKQ
ncbi:MAG: hypothetical protein KC414_08030 [Romboutsia sp.]|nr:hypothetical protein [Romboutsia sp.]